MAYLTVDDKEVFREKGYVIKRDVVAPQQMEAGRAGTAMIWHSHLVHSASVNCSDEIRMAIITRFRWTNWDDLKFEDPDDMWEYWEGM